MSTHSAHAGLPARLPLEVHPVASSGVSWRVLPAVGVLVVLAVGLRVWNMDTTFETSDQAAMPCMICSEYGIEWIFAHDYGPVLPAIHKGWAMVWCGLGQPYNEIAARVPVALIGLTLVGVSYLLVRRLHATRAQAYIAALFLSVVPCLVVDSHYPWGDHAVWVLFGAIAMWSILAYGDTGRKRYLLVTAIALFAHCLSSLYAFALPLTLMAGWWFFWRREHAGKNDGRLRDGSCGSGSHAERSQDSPRHTTAVPRRAHHDTSCSRRVTAGSLMVGFVLPCVLALVVIVASWWWTGGGQIGHLLEKRDVETFGLHLHQIPRLPGMWMGQFGLIFGLITAVSMVWVVITTCRGRHHKNGDVASLQTPLRVGLIGIWAWMGLLPFVLIADWNATGYAQYYMFEVVYAASILGVLAMCRAWRQWGRERVALALVGALAFGQLGLASVDAVLPDLNLTRYTGIRTGWGDVRPDSGVKAVGWYVRKNVPPDAAIMALHTNEGMEVPVAEYYIGRKVLAHYDLLPRAIGPLWEAMCDRVDVLIVEPRHEELVRDRPEWQRAFTATRDGVVVRLIYTRWGFANSEMSMDVHDANALYDRECHAMRVPYPMKAPPGFHDVLGEYQRHIRDLGAMRFRSTLPGKKRLKAKG